MSISPLLTSTIRAPIPSNQLSVPYHVGGDDTQGWHSGLIGKVAEWDLDINKSCLTANCLFVVKKIFDFLDSSGFGHFVFGHFYGLSGTSQALSGFNGKLQQYKYFQTGVERNRVAREKIVFGLGGQETCRAFRSLLLTDREYSQCWSSGNFDLQESYFNSGESIVQGETPAGTKFAAIRLTERSTNRIFIATIKQLYRETHIALGEIDGSKWHVSIFPFLPDSQITDITAHNADEAAEFARTLCSGQHREFVLSPKP
jgi:hypothetical protein